MIQRDKPIQLEDGPFENRDIEADIDAVLASFDGDPRAAVRALIIANGFWMEELERSREAISPGYTRGWRPS